MSLPLDVGTVAMSDDDLLREVIQVASDVIFHLDRDGRFRLVSPSWTALTGHPVEATIGRSIREFVHPADAEPLQRLLLPLREAARSAARGRIRFRTDADSSRWVHVTANVTRDRAGRRSGVAGTLTDVTMQHALETMAVVTGNLDARMVAREDPRAVADDICAVMTASTLAGAAGIGLRGDSGRWELLGQSGPGREAFVDMMGAPGSAERVVAGGVLHGGIRWRDLDPGAGPGVAAMVASGLRYLIVTTARVESDDDLMIALATDSRPGSEPRLATMLRAFAQRLAMSLVLQRQQAALALRAAAMEASATALLIVDIPAERIRWLNSAFERLTLYRREELIGQKVREAWGAHTWSDDVISALASPVYAGENGHAEVLAHRKDGSTYMASATTWPVREKGQVTHAIVAVEDVTARRKAEADAAHMARHDPVTGLPNRAYLTEELDRAAAASRRDGTSFAVLFVDLDRFKMVNDTLGHAAGDQLLREVAARLGAGVRRGDFVARCGGDEFVVIAHGAERQAATFIGQRMIDELQMPFMLAGREAVITASVGIAIGSAAVSSPDVLLQQSDAAMYRAKHAGRNGVACFDEAEDEIHSRSFIVQAALRNAIGTDELSLVFQPQIDLATGDLVAVETLTRWTSSELGTVSPAEFVDVAEKTGLIVELDEWVLRRSCAQMRAWVDRGIPVPRVAVNISGVTVLHGTLLESVERALADAGLSPDRLEIELTETAAMSDAASIVRTLDGLSAMGVRVALDDFGTGMSSLAYLRRFEIDTLKIDRSFVKELPDAADAAAIARLIVSMAGTLRLHTVAEGVETPAQWACLRALGCGAAQGFLVAPGLPPAKLEALVRAESWRDRIDPPRHEVVVEPLAATGT